MRPSLLWLTAMLAFPVDAWTQSSMEGQAARVVVQVCGACHGAEGDSISPLFPRLAGQHAQYLETQLKYFRGRLRADPPAMAYMWGMAAQLDDATIRAIAAYYASRPFPAGTKAPGAESATGKTIYERSRTPNVPSCSTCHGAGGEGAAGVPRLAGQHPEYLLRQLKFYKSRLRSTDAVMVAACAELTTDEMQAVARYLASL